MSVVSNNSQVSFPYEKTVLEKIDGQTYRGTEKTELVFTKVGDEIKELELQDCKALADKLVAYHLVVKNNPRDKSIGCHFTNLLLSKNDFMVSHKDFVIENFRIDCKP